MDKILSIFRIPLSTARLQRKLTCKLKEISESAEATDDKIREIKALQTAIALVRDEADAYLLSPRRLASILVIGGLVFLAALLILRLSTADMVLNAELSRVEFTTADNIAPYNILSVSQATVDGPVKLMPRGSQDPATVSLIELHNPQGGQAALFEIAAVSQGSIVNLSRPEANVIVIRIIANDDSSNICLHPQGGAKLRVDELEIPQASAQGPSSSPLCISPIAKKSVSVRLSMHENVSDVVWSDIVISKMSFRGIEANSQRAISWLKSGTLSFPRIETSTTLLPDMAHIEAKFDVAYLWLSLASNITLKAIVRANVSEMSVGTPTSMRSTKPRLFEWLKSQNELALFFGAASYVCGLAMGVKKWFSSRT